MFVWLLEEEGAAYLLKLYGMDPTAAGNYSTISNRQLSTALQKSAAAKSGSSGSSGRSSGSSGSGTKSGYSTSQLLQIANKFAGMEETNPMYNYYQQVLAEEGMLDDGTSSTGGSTGSSTDDGVDMAYMLAKNYAKKGYSSWAIMNNMHANGYSDDEIARALEKAGVRN